MPIPAALAAALAALDITVTPHEHPPLRTVADAHAYWDGLDGAQVKNLFLKDAGGQLWLVVVPGDPRMDTKAMAGLIGAKRLSFASAELLREVLGVEPGAVTPLALMNDIARRVRAVLHAGLMEAGRWRSGRCRHVGHRPHAEFERQRRHEERARRAAAHD